MPPHCICRKPRSANFTAEPIFPRIRRGLLPTAATADHYGQIRAALAKAGTPIPENDIWIAALAKEFQLPLAARDRHFDLIAGLQVLKW
jgi:predicted nucleic acid-binding protein